MIRMRAFRQWSALLLVLVAFALAQAQTTPFEPQSGQPGKDVVWVPTPQMLVEKMLDMAQVTPKDYVIDLGSGDGRTVITAARRGALARGIEFNPEMVDLSVRNASKEGVADRATFVKEDLFDADLSQATVITMFLLPSINVQVRPKLLSLKPGTRIVSNSFTMDDWLADETGEVKEDCVSWCTAFLWIVPAKVEGTWQLPKGTLVLEQRFQKVTGTLTAGGRPEAISDGTLRGDRLTFTVAGVPYAGRVKGNVIDGLTAGTKSIGRATRTPEPAPAR